MPSTHPARERDRSPIETGQEAPAQVSRTRPAEVQRTPVPGLAWVQRAVQVGAADDPLEYEAERVAAEVVTRLRRRPTDGEAAVGHTHDGCCGAAAGVRRHAAPGDGGAVGLSGGLLDATSEAKLQASRGAGSMIAPTVRAPLEQALGADLSAVRLHAGSEASALNRSMSAQAFTHGRDIYFRDGLPDVATDAGLHLLSHELTHTLQQGATAPVRRSIGFEFETQQMLTKKSTTGKPPKNGFPDDDTADTMERAAVRLSKGAVLLKRPDIEVQADDGQLGSDLEVVVSHLPEDAGGRARLVAALTDLQALVAAHVRLAQGHTTPAVALDGVGGFSSKMRDGLIYGEWDRAKTSPQVTMGIRVENVSNLVEDLHDAPGESVGKTNKRAAGRRKMRRDDANDATKPTPVQGGSEVDTLVRAHGIARAAIADFQTHVDGAAPGDAALTGLLTIVFTYTESMARKQSFLKNHTPLMAKTDLATIWRTLPPATGQYYAQVDAGVSKFEQLVARAPGYAARMNKSLFDGVSGLAEDDRRPDLPQWYHNLTLEDWLRSICVSRNPTRAEAVRDFFRGFRKNRTSDKLSTKSFPGRPGNQEVEGYAALGKRMDTGANNVALPVFELRSASRQITFAEAQQWALDMFDYVVSMNANPNGGYQRIT